MFTNSYYNDHRTGVEPNSSHIAIYVYRKYLIASYPFFQLAGNYVKAQKHLHITCQDIKVAMCADKVRCLKGCMKA